MKYLLHAIFFTIALATTACANQEDVDIDLRSLVIEGWIDDGGFPVVIVTHNLPVTNKFISIDSLSSYLVRWATVSVSDGLDTVYLTGMANKRYFPPFIYTTGKMRGKAGNTYKLTVEYNGMIACAETTIPATHPVIDSLWVSKSADADTLHQLFVTLKGDKQSHNYYQIFTRNGTYDAQFLPSHLGTIDNAYIPEGSIIPVYKARKFRENNYSPYFTINDTISLKVAVVDKTSYDFWDDYCKMLNLSGNLFLAQSNDLRSNIVGGYGYWCGYNADVKYIAIKNLH